jgi:hypothetical protein
MAAPAAAHEEAAAAPGSHPLSHDDIVTSSEAPALSQAMDGQNNVPEHSAVSAAPGDVTPASQGPPAAEGASGHEQAPSSGAVLQPGPQPRREEEAIAAVDAAADDGGGPGGEAVEFEGLQLGGSCRAPVEGDESPEQQVVISGQPVSPKNSLPELQPAHTAAAAAGLDENADSAHLAAAGKSQEPCVSASSAGSCAGAAACESAGRGVPVAKKAGPGEGSSSGGAVEGGKEAESGRTLARADAEDASASSSSAAAAGQEEARSPGPNAPETPGREGSGERALGAGASPPTPPRSQGGLAASPTRERGSLDGAARSLQDELQSAAATGSADAPSAQDAAAANGARRASSSGSGSGGILNAASAAIKLVLARNRAKAQKKSRRSGAADAAKAAAAPLDGALQSPPQASAAAAASPARRAFGNGPVSPRRAEPIALESPKRPWH